MDRIITATEANQRFSEMLRDVQSGDSFVVTSRGQPIARVAPLDDVESDEALVRQTQRLGDLLETLRRRPFRVVGPWTREDLYS